MSKSETNKPSRRGGLFHCEYSNSEIVGLINEWIHNEQHRAILIDRFVNGLTYERLAERHDVSVRWAKIIIKNGEQKLLPHLRLPK